MQEIWKKIITEDGIYENYKVSNLGKVKSLRDCHGNYREKILSPCKNKNGYLTVCLCKNGKIKRYSIHRLVAYAFIPNVMNYKCIDHRDTNRKNNNVLNLIWVTHKQNNNNELTRMKNSEAKKGKHHSEETKKKMSKKVICLETGKKFNSIKEASEQLGINDGDIASVCRGKRKQAGKLTFRHLDQVLFYN